MSTITLNIFRGNDRTEGRFVEYKVPFVEGSSLLDAIFQIRETEDSSLAVRYSCKSANACKECMAVVDGKAGYLCSIRAGANTSVTIQPLKGRPLIKDLVVDME